MTYRVFGAIGVSSITNEPNEIKQWAKNCLKVAWERAKAMKNLCIILSLRLICYNLKTLSTQHFNLLTWHSQTFNRKKSENKKLKKKTRKQNFLEIRSFTLFFHKIISRYLETTAWTTLHFCSTLRMLKVFDAFHSKCYKIHPNKFDLKWLSTNTSFWAAKKGRYNSLPRRWGQLFKIVQYLKPSNIIIFRVFLICYWTEWNNVFKHVV